MSIATSTPPRIGAGPHTFRMLVCLDRSPCSEACLPYAVSLATTFGSDITLVHVMQPRNGHGDRTPRTRWAGRSRGKKRAHTSSGSDRRPRKRWGAPSTSGSSKVIRPSASSALARELGADLTVLGSHGEGGVTAWNLGSTVQQVLAMTRGSVFIAHSSPAAPSVALPKRILVPLDGSLRTESVLPTAARIARAYGAEILLVHVVQAPIASSVLRAGAELELAHGPRRAARIQRQAVPAESPRSARTRSPRGAHAGRSTCRTSGSACSRSRSRSTSISSWSRLTASRAIRRDRSAASRRTCSRTRTCPCSSSRTSRESRGRAPERRRRPARAAAPRELSARGGVSAAPNTALRADAGRPPGLDADARALAETQRDLERTTTAVARSPVPSPVARALERAQKRLAATHTGDAALPKAAEWFLDNYYLIRRVARQVDEELPQGFVRHLPRLASGPSKGVARIEVLARGAGRAERIELDVGALRRFVDAYQEVSPLTIAELWALPTMLRASVLRHLLGFLERLARPPSAARIRATTGVAALPRSIPAPAWSAPSARCACSTRSTGRRSSRRPVGSRPSCATIRRGVYAPDGLRDLRLVPQGRRGARLGDRPRRAGGGGARHRARARAPRRTSAAATSATTSSTAADARWSSGSAIARSGSSACGER